MAEMMKLEDKELKWDATNKTNVLKRFKENKNIMWGKWKKDQTPFGEIKDTVPLLFTGWC